MTAYVKINVIDGMFVIDIHKGVYINNIHCWEMSVIFSSKASSSFGLCGTHVPLSTGVGS